MQDITKKKNKKSGPIICSIIIIAFLALCIGVIIFPLLGESYGDAAAIGVLLVYALFIIVVIIGILIALRQRLKEIKGGKEEDARKY